MIVIKILITLIVCVCFGGLSWALFLEVHPLMAAWTSILMLNVAAMAVYATWKGCAAWQ